VLTCYVSITTKSNLMKRIITQLSALALVAGLGAFATGCTPTTNGPTGNGVGAPSGLKVNSLSSSSIGVTWARGTSDVTADTVVAVPTDGSATAFAYASSTQSSQILTGLKNGVSYSITVRSSGGSSSATSWAPADRTPTNPTGFITLYESADNTPGHPSGLDLDVNNVGAVSTSGMSPLADIVLGSDKTLVPSGIFLVSAGVSGSGITNGAKMAIFNDATGFVNGGLDSDYYPTATDNDLGSLFPGNKNSIDFVANFATSDTRDAIIRIKTSTGHYVRLDVIRQSNGSLWRTVTDNNGTPRNAIDVRVSEQASANLPYAGRGVPKGTAPFARNPATQTYRIN
jgi:hypothetical protein